MYKWYRVPIDTLDGVQYPKYSDSIACEGFSGQVVNSYFVVKLYGSKDFHNALVSESDVYSLSESDVEDIFNGEFSQDLMFNEWDTKFRIV